MMRQGAQTGIDLPRRQPLREVEKFFSIQFFAFIFLQKFAIPLPGAPPISVPLLMVLGGLFVLARRKALTIGWDALVTYASFVAVLLLTHMFVRGPFSAPSLIILIVTYFMLVVELEVPEATYLAIMRKYTDFMLIPAAMVFVQIAWQQIFGMGHTLSIESFVPEALLLPGYAYEAPIHWGASFVRPNGFFMLEPSFVSAALGSAATIELLYFKRLFRQFFYLGALLSSFGGTGMTILALAAPFIVARWPVRLIATNAVVLAVLLAAGVYFDVFSQMFSRVEEFGSTTSSAYSRMVAPITQLMEAVYDPSHLLVGSGAGSIDTSVISSWPIVKVYWEYGFVADILFVVLFFLGMRRCPALAIGFPLAMIYMFTGGYLLSPIVVLQMVLLCTLLRPKSAAKADAPANAVVPA